MRRLTWLVVAGCGLMLLACAEKSSSDSVVESSEDFPEFAGTLDRHLQDGDMDFLIDRMLTQHAVCTEADLDRQVGARYDCDEVGEEYDGFSYGIWATDCCPLLRRSKIEEILRQTFAGVRPDVRDDFGGGVDAVRAAGVEMEIDEARRRGSVPLQLVQHAVDEAGGLVGAEPFCHLDGLVDGHLRRDVGKGA